MSSHALASGGPRARGGRAPLPRTRRAARQRDLRTDGQPMIWLTGGALALGVLMIVGLLGLIAWQGVTTFWPVPAVRLELASGRVVQGEVTREESYRPRPDEIDALPETARLPARDDLAAAAGTARRRLVRTGNYDLTGTHYTWVSDFEVVRESAPAWLLVVERQAWGRLYGTPRAFLRDGQAEDTTPEGVWALVQEHHAAARDRQQARRRIEKHEIGTVNRRLEDARLDVRRAEMAEGAGSPEHVGAQEILRRIEETSAGRFEALQARIAELDRENARLGLALVSSDGQEVTLGLADVVRAYPANGLGVGEKLRVYVSRWVEFLADDPREANSEGGVFPAIFGTLAMTLLMSCLVVPFGVLAAIYLREYARAGAVVSAVRIAVNNLAGVPSIVFGVFGLGFFCYFLGGTLDRIFFAESLPNPTLGTGGLTWASFTLALLTLPVVIVATEEALASVPGSMREGSYACGASKWQTIWRIVLRRAMPGIMTGTILAMARGAGEVAPLMLVGAVKLAPELPVDGVFPFIHPERSFMHLGFHVYDLGFQSQNSEAAKPMVFTTTLLLIAVIFTLNVAAVLLRTRMRRRVAGAQF
jgi:phosphate transport system permease protein